MELQKGLKDRRSDLLVRFGEPESIVPKLVGHLQQQADVDIELFCQKEVMDFVALTVLQLNEYAISKRTKKPRSRRRCASAAR